jgi:hypothetical protein
MALNTTNPNFPSPYVNKTEAEDPMMKRVPMKNMDIGARSSGMPKDGPNGPGSIEHVSNRST